MKKRKAVGDLQRAALCCLAAWIGSLLLCGALSWVILREVISYEMGRTLAVLVGAACLFAGCLTATKPIPQRKLLWALGMAAAYAGAGLLVRTAIDPGVGIGVDYRLVMPFAAAVLAGLLASRRPNHRRR